MIFLRDNVLLERDLRVSDIKPRLLGKPPNGVKMNMPTANLTKYTGHWGTCPGLILMWSHLNLLLQRTDTDIMFVIGPGHGAPAALASLWLEGSMERFYPERYPTNQDGLHNLITGFSTPGGFPR